MNKLTADAERLSKFLNDYPNEWHSISNDKQTTKALNEVLNKVPGHYEIVKYEGYAQTQVKLINLKASVSISEFEKSMPQNGE